MTNGEMYLKAMDSIRKKKNDCEHILNDLVLNRLAHINYYSNKVNGKPYTHEDTITLVEPIKMHCPRGCNEDIEITNLHWETNTITLFYCTKDNRMFTKFDFGAEDFVDMVFKIIKENF